MNTAFVRVVPILCVCAFARFCYAGDFQTVIMLPSSNPTLTISVPGDHFVVIRNFTQEGGTTRGTVQANLLISGLTANILTAAIIDPANVNPGSLEVINDVYVGGPATVTVTCPSDATSCAVTYRRRSE
jgi:hypothetical protein